MKGYGKLSFRSLKKPKRPGWNQSTIRRFLFLSSPKQKGKKDTWSQVRLKSRNLSCFVVYSSFSKTAPLQRLLSEKGMQSSKLGLWKGYHLSIKGIRIGTFSVKNGCIEYNKKGKRLDLGAEPPLIKLSWISPPPHHNNTKIGCF